MSVGCSDTAGENKHKKRGDQMPKRLAMPKDKVLATLLINIKWLCYTCGISEKEFNAIIRCKDSAALARRKDPSKFTLGQLMAIAKRCNVSVEDLFKRIN